MPGPLTATEKAQNKDHGNWGTGTTPAAYVEVYVNPALDALVDEAQLAVVRGHLAECEALYTQLKSAKEDFSLTEAKGIKFANDTENRLYGMYTFWRDKLYSTLDLKTNTLSTRRRNRQIL